MLFIFFIILFDFFFSSDSFLYQPLSAEKTLFSLPLHEREDFLAYSLGDGYYQNCTCVERSLSFPYPDGLGIKKERINKFQKLNVPENFTTNLYAWVKARFNMEQEELRQLILERNVCLTDEKCIDLNDIGALCCPF
ncbi:uncharacterized protein LOC122853190 [Aphidius gifuensis]|uniref:uncharacterized protein LOC122853190 n=1 Tax=Aphidius gifuensis TaxID=684658 RepID=UPI001CDC7E31|nr:uncharacterized protein LOC122853190 [Aphidius gifuensis]